MRPSLQAVFPSDAAARRRLRLLHWFVTPGWFVHTPADKIRGWARVLDWKAMTPAEQRWTAKRLVLRPVELWRRAAAEVDVFGAEVQEHHGVSRGRQRFQLWWLALRHGTDRLGYLDYQYYRPERRRIAAEYLQVREYYRVIRWYNKVHADSDAPTMLDKDRFAAWCREKGFPAVQTLVEFDDGELAVSYLDGDAATSLPPRDLFSKPIDGTGGHGTERWRYVEDPNDPADPRRWIARDGRHRTAEEVLAFIADVSRSLPSKYGRTSRRVILQPCLHTHRDLMPLTTGALCTARILTYREQGGKSRAIAGAFRAAVGDTPADNFSAGGIAMSVDLASGRLGPALRRLTHGTLTPIDRHPDTGATIEGRVLPYWREAVELCERASDAARRVVSLGWDVAITDDGPVLIEGNPASHPGISQRFTGIPLSRTPLPEVLDEHMRELLLDSSR